jgi:hypothetical protein
MVVSNSIASRDLAARLASSLGLGSGPVIGSLLGGLTAVWLVVGGPKRIAGFMGLTCGLAAAVGLWAVARANMWIVDVVLEGAFGPGASGFSTLAVLAVLLVAVRLVADIVAVTAGKLLGRAGSSS